MDKFDLVICGSGPAGLSAARTAHLCGLSVAIIDEQTQSGGQIYRNVTKASKNLHEILGNEYSVGLKLAELPEEISQYLNAKIWRVEKSGRVAFSQNGTSHIIKGEKIILATGALERPMPIEGWTLPGVMGVGAAQILLKTSGVLPKQAVLAGSGPLIYLFAAQMIRAGHPPLALIETQSWKNTLNAAFHPISAWYGIEQIFKGLKLIREISAAKVPRYSACTNVKIIGVSEAEGINFNSQGKPITIKASTILLHQGVVPNIQISKSLDLDHIWNSNLHCFEPKTDINGQSSNPRFYICGDGAGIKGAVAAQISGEIAALAIANKKDENSQNMKKLRKSLKKESAFRIFIDKLYETPYEILHPDDDVIICRCEEVSAGEVRNLASSAVGINQVKALSRVGMGPCQGRYCGLTISQICAEKDNKKEAGYFRIRPPIKPISLGELANLKGIKND